MCSIDEGGDARGHYDGSSYTTITERQPHETGSTNRTRQPDPVRYTRQAVRSARHAGMVASGATGRVTKPMAIGGIEAHVGSDSGECSGRWNVCTRPSRNTSCSGVGNTTGVLGVRSKRSNTFAISAPSAGLTYRTTVTQQSPGACRSSVRLMTCFKPRAVHIWFAKFVTLHPLRYVFSSWLRSFCDVWGRKVGPDQPVVVGAQLLAGDSPAGCAIYCKATFNRDASHFPIRDSLIGHANRSSNMTANTWAIEWMCIFHSSILHFLCSFRHILFNQCVRLEV